MTVREWLDSFSIKEFLEQRKHLVTGKRAEELNLILEKIKKAEQKGFVPFKLYVSNVEGIVYNVKLDVIYHAERPSFKNAKMHLDFVLAKALEETDSSGLRIYEQFNPSTLFVIKAQQGNQEHYGRKIIESPSI